LSAAEHFDYGSGAPVNVVEPDDIIFTEIAAGLHLDQFERNLSQICQPMDSADWNVGRLVLVHSLLFLADRYRSGAAYNHPMLGAMQVSLQ
jgi:hypothetical protein